MGTPCYYYIIALSMDIILFSLCSILRLDYIQQASYSNFKLNESAGPGVSIIASRRSGTIFLVRRTAVPSGR